MNWLESALMGYLASYLWPFIRISSMIGAMYIIGSSVMPVRVRLVLAVVLSWAITPLIPVINPGVELMSIEGFLVTINQVIIGSVMGFTTELLSQCFIMAGQVIAMQTGLGFASVMDPVNGSSTPVVGQFFSMACALVFFGIDGHLVFIELLYRSFTTVPVGLDFLPPDSYHHIFSFLSVMFQTAVNFSIASICTMLIINITFGILTRAAPQLNIFSMGFAVSLILGVGVLWMAMGDFMSFFSYQFDQTTDLICRVFGDNCVGGLR